MGIIRMEEERSRFPRRRKMKEKKSSEGGRKMRITTGITRPVPQKNAGNAMPQKAALETTPTQRTPNHEQPPRI